MSRVFRTAFVIEKGKLNDLSALEKHAIKIKYVLNGTEQDLEIVDAIRENFVGYSPGADVIIPTGRVISSLLFGYLLEPWIEITIGIYRDKDYTFLTIPL